MKLIMFIVKRIEGDDRPPEEWRVRVSDITIPSTVKTQLAKLSPKIALADQYLGTVSP